MSAVDARTAPTGARNLAIWVIYDNPIDHPGEMVARKWEVMPGGRLYASKDCFTAKTLEALREMLPRDLYRMERDVSDPPHVVESWL